MRKRFHKIGNAFIIWGIIGIAIVSCTNTLIVENNYGEVFRAFWEIMDQRYVNFAEHPLDWDSIWTVYYPKACQAQSEDELKRHLGYLLNQDLQDGHVSIMNRADECIISVFGPRDGDSDPYTDTAYSCLIYRYSPIYIQHPVYSGIITPLTDTLGISPATYDTCAYISLDKFELHTDTYAREAICAVNCYTPKGWIIDLRGNNGGWAAAMLNFCSYFYTGERQLLHYYVRVSRDDRFTMKDIGSCTMAGQGLVSEKIPVIVIIDYSVYSAANICTYILSELPNVTVVGICPTAGGGASPTPTRLPNGWKLYAPTTSKIVVNNKSTEYPFMPDSIVFPYNDCDLTYLVGTDTTLDISTYIALSLIDKETHE